MNTVKIINKSGYALPQYETEGSSGMDIRLNLREDSFITLGPLQRTLASTGLFAEIPAGYEIQVRPRSGLAWKHGVTVLNTPGTIDSDYRGEIKVILVNLSDSNHVIMGGERIAQLVFAPVEKMEWEVIEQTTDTERGSGGFGSTGTV